MQSDKTTLKDLSIFSANADESIFGLLDHTVTHAGREALRRHLLHPPDNPERLKQVQDVIKYWYKHPQNWPDSISNGTLVMLEKFFETADHAVTPPSPVNILLGNFFQKLLNKNEYHFTQFSLTHLSDLLKGVLKLTDILSEENVPVLLRNQLDVMKADADHRLTAEILRIDTNTSFRDLANLGFKVRREMKNHALRLMASFALLDAWHSLSIATLKNDWYFPVLQPSFPVNYTANGLYHPLLKEAVAYNISFTERRNFLLLTGANMSGKTTFMRALGVNAMLAHIGAGVCAKECSIGFMEGIITNMHVEDDLLKGESYFFAEVQRIKMTAQKLQHTGPLLVLMDELFKGTNVHDAYECTRAVVEGLLQRPNHIMVLSTHLYEVAQHFSNRPDIIFNHFVTELSANGNYRFTYELKNGISNDRIGYRILQKEGVIDLLKGQ